MQSLTMSADLLQSATSSIGNSDHQVLNVAWMPLYLFCDCQAKNLSMVSDVFSACLRFCLQVLCLCFHCLLLLSLLCKNWPAGLEEAQLKCHDRSS